MLVVEAQIATVALVEARRWKSAAWRLGYPQGAAPPPPAQCASALAGPAFCMPQSRTKSTHSIEPRKVLPAAEVATTFCGWFGDTSVGSMSWRKQSSVLVTPTPGAGAGSGRAETLKTRTHLYDSVGAGSHVSMKSAMIAMSVLANTKSASR
ncbi:hypothetical protein TSOC_012091 [Tetrabaena socialis]|uniref:Uncharacterized protein n=1 Tax=Tetrabaena socialis TaxID=47790 RepID=A0A2J7ZNX2_9CHLO|nr:hypothetical protein TSOC_012091 [Tetrabaena socialis]|eukprot:PNH01973.1 hypothetical protein TSOC_012091 [Tetrabaena socialis]